MADDYETHKNKRPDKTYIRRSLAFKRQEDRRIRIASKVIDSSETHTFAVEHGEHVIRVTDGGRQEIVAKFYEDNRGVYVLTLQRFTTETGVPHQTHFSFVGEEIPRLLEFISNLRLVQFPSDERVNVTDRDLKKLLLSPDQIRNVLVQNQELVLQLARSEITTSDLVALGYRRKQLDEYEKLLLDGDYFEHQKRESGRGAEGVWQAFFERNKWIFGYGLTYVSLSNLDQRKLEQAVVGHDVSGKGKRADALMKTRGAIEALCFVEIKAHTTHLLQNAPYRSGCWAPSEDLAGGVAQVQGTVENALRRLTEKIEPTSDDGEPTGEELFAYQPKSFLVVGRLDELRSERGINMEKYRSFELYRRHTHRPEIITVRRTVSPCPIHRGAPRDLRRTTGMKILCFQVQPKRSRGIDLDAVAALMARIAMSSDIREFTIQRGRGKNPWVNFLFTSASVARIWSRLESGAITHNRLGAKLRRSSIVTCQGSRGWNNYRLLRHFDSRQALDRLRRTG